MIENFKNELLNFIGIGGVKLLAPDVIKAEFDGVNTSIGHYSFITLGGASPVRFFLRHNLVYSLIVAVFESENPELEDKGYATKYKSLPETNDFGTAIKKKYRILSFMRNVIVHNKIKLTIRYALGGVFNLRYIQWCRKFTL